MTYITHPSGQAGCDIARAHTWDEHWNSQHGIIGSTPNFHGGCYSCRHGLFPGHKHIPRPDDVPASFSLPVDARGRPQVWVGSWER